MIAENLFDGFRQPLNVTHGVENSAAVSQQISASADIAGDYRGSNAHGFKDASRQPFVPGGQQEHITRTQQGWNILAKAKEVHSLAETLAVDVCFQMLAQLAVSCERHVCGGISPITSSNA
jgi:hypothetical protein